MSKAKLTATEWDLVKDAPYWVNAALAAADGRVALITSRREAGAFSKALKGYESNNALIKDVLADESDPAREIKDATLSDAEKALSQIATIVENKLGGDDLDAFSDFLLHIGNTVAEAAGERVLGIGDNVSKKEAAALETIAEALKATEGQKRQRQQEQARKTREEQARRDAEAKARQEAEAKAKQEAERAKAAAEAKAKQEAERARAEKARAEEAEKARAEKAKAAAEIQAKMKAEALKREADAKAREAAAAKEKAEREAAAAAAAQAPAAQETAAAEAPAQEFITEHTVVSGDNLSMISQKYYGTQTKWRFIYEANKQVIGDNPSLIRVGQVLRIPKV